MDIDGHPLGVAAWSVVKRSIGDNAPLAGVREGALIYAYCPDQNLPNKVIVTQRLIEPILLPPNGLNREHHPANGPRNGADTLHNLLSLETMGWPMLLSCDFHWRAPRLRYQIWQNVVKWHTPGSEGENLSRQAMANTDMMSQFRLSEELSIRAVSLSGDPVLSPNSPGKEDTEIMEDWKAFCSVITAVDAVSLQSSSIESKNSSSNRGSSSSGSNGNGSSSSTQTDAVSSENRRVLNDWSSTVINDPSLGPLEQYLGEELPVDKTLSIDQLPYSNNANVLFFSVDWLGGDLPNKSFNMDLARKYHPPLAGLRAKKDITLADCLRGHTSEEELEDGNEVYCSQCKEHKGAKKIIQFHQAYLPDTLIVNFKRFEKSQRQQHYRGMKYQTNDKIDTFVEFPMDGLDLAPFCHRATHSDRTEDGTSSERSPGTGTGKESSKSTKYDLFAVCNHYGRLGYGHYTASARELTWENTSTSGAGHWYHYDDEEVTLAAKGAAGDALKREVVTNSAYILFYRRRDSG